MDELKDLKDLEDLKDLLDDLDKRDGALGFALGALVGGIAGAAVSLVGGRPFLRIPISSYMGAMTYGMLAATDTKFTGGNLSLISGFILAPAVAVVGNFVIIPLPTLL